MDTLKTRFGSARRQSGRVIRGRPPEATDDLIKALGTLSEALEVVETARGKLYEFHRLCGTADRVLQDAVDRFRQCGERELADDIEAVLVGRNVIDDHWSFELVEDYDAGYWSVFRAVEEYTRTRLGVPEHCLEAEMKSAEQFER